MRKILFSLTALTLAATSLIAAPQAIVFDYGGVLTAKSHHEGREMIVSFLRDSFHLSQEEFEKVNQEKRLALKQGKTDEEFWLAYGKAKGIKLPANWAADYKQVKKEIIRVSPQMYALVDQLREKQIPVALFSNVDERLAKAIRDCGFYEPFSPCVLSYEIGVDKPDPKAYEILLQKLKVPAKDVVFIDDLQENIQAAKAAGIDAILFESEQQLRSELSQRGVL